MNILIHRIYDAEQPEGFRALVDRLWPRGISKERARLDGWYKDVAPSPALRQWFDHDAQKWGEFKQRYWQELEQNQHHALDLLEDAKGDSTLILLYGAKNPVYNHAVVLQSFLEELLKTGNQRQFSSPVCYASDFDMKDH